MRSVEPLVAPGSSYYSHVPSQLAQEHFLYPVCAGDFTYLPGYRLSRAAFNSWLMEVILSGSLDIEAEGKGWYRIVLPRDLSAEREFLRFRGAYRDTEVYVNGRLAGRHTGSGYTPFTLEITDFLPPQGDTDVTVSVDNSFSENALPYGRSFDWANDGGLYRPVEWIRTGKIRIQDAEILARPIILPNGCRQNAGQAIFGFRASLSGAEPGDQLRWALYEGAAETREDIEKMLALLKESNSVLTRFHWQQDDLVYDWCDRHGLLIQEEIPFWGKQPEGDPEALWPVVERQLEEMILAHRHHPSIIAWGVGNELSGQREGVQRYVRRAAARARELDPTRPANYVSNTAWQNPAQDGAKDGDILCINDYIGTWHQGLEQESAWRELLAAHPGRAFIPSEYGLCEPAFSGGDGAREKIFLEKTASYRPKPQIVGTVYFCLNDYRTHMGEEGEGRLRRRVHGSADMRGNPKPSYFTVRREHAPLTAERTENSLRVACRNDLPRYMVQGYYIQNGGSRIPLPDLKPGECWVYAGALENGSVSIHRPNGDFVLNV